MSSIFNSTCNLPLMQRYSFSAMLCLVLLSLVVRLIPLRSWEILTNDSVPWLPLKYRGGNAHPALLIPVHRSVALPRAKLHTLEIVLTKASQCNVARTVLTLKTPTRSRRVTTLQIQSMAFVLYGRTGRTAYTARSVKNNASLGFVARLWETLAGATTSAMVKGQRLFARVVIANLQQTRRAIAPITTTAWKEPHASRTATVVTAGMVQVTVAPMVRNVSGARDLWRSASVGVVLIHSKKTASALMATYVSVRVDWHQKRQWYALGNPRTRYDKVQSTIDAYPNCQKMHHVRASWTASKVLVKLGFAHQVSRIHQTQMTLR
jgi:hypothetical protein